ncbi:Rrf2 family transcriptional regulator [Candidatus Nitromaritima sp. SCGC AAA799-C22]|nr:Rrf2 family transcriptional regulator [Candidatus Nitromaritima sp. SCGC AAA799-C22]
MISQTTEYALRAVVCLATQPKTPLTTQEIASRTQVPESYLSKVLQALGRAGIVHSQRGLHGGFSLAAKPDALTLLEVINAIDPIHPIKECPLKLETHGTSLCPLHSRINQSIESLEKVFGKTTFAELLAESPDQKPLC